MTPLEAAREAVLAATTGGRDGAREALAASGADMAEVAVLLAAMLARPGDIILSDREYIDLLQGQLDRVNALLKRLP